MNIIDFDDLLDPGKPVLLKARDGKEYTVDAWVPARASAVVLKNLDEVRRFLVGKKATDETYDMLRDVCVVVAKRQYPFMDAEWFDANVGLFQFAEFAGKIVWQALDFISPDLKKAVKQETGKVQNPASSQSGSEE